MKNKERNQQEQLVNEAKAYFDANGLSASLDIFFASEPVKALIHEKYAGFEATVDEIVTEAIDAELPEVIIDRARSVAEVVKGNEEKYADDVRLSVLCTLYNLFKGIEAFVKLDEKIITLYENALTKEEDNAALMKSFEEICDGVIGKMTDKMVKMICVPHGLPDDIVNILMMIGGGMPMMNLEEMEKMFGSHDDDDEDGDTEEEAAEAEEGDATC